MANTIYQIYDKIFKKILPLSSTAVVNLINGLFDTDYPTDTPLPITGLNLKMTS